MGTMRNPVDTGRTSGVPKHDTGETVQRKIYEVEIMEKREINTELLRRRKHQLRAEIQEIDALLALVQD